LEDSSRTGDPAADRMAVAAAVVAEMRQRVTAATRLTCSAGIAVNPLLAKIASDGGQAGRYHSHGLCLPRVCACALLAAAEQGAPKVQSRACLARLCGLAQ
jgi:nucleotidyltransferase/DNA polymerase involved in DNA repair